MKSIILIAATLFLTFPYVPSISQGIDTAYRLGQDKDIIEKNDKKNYVGNYFMVSPGIGYSYGIYGVRFQIRKGGNTGYGVHAGIGYNPNGNAFAIALNGGFKFFPYRNLYVNAQFGYYGTEAIVRDYTIIGPSLLVGSDWRWGHNRGLGISFGLGSFYNIAPSYTYLSLTLDLGINISFNRRKQLETQDTLEKDIAPKALPFSTAVLKIEKASLTDPNQNNRIDPGEECTLQFTVKNTGTAIASALKVSIDEKNNALGLFYDKKMNLGDLPQGGSKNLSIPVVGSNQLVDGTARFVINVKTANGVEAEPVEITAVTHKPVIHDTIIKEVKKKEVVMKEVLKKQVEEKLTQDKATENIQTNVTAEVVEEKDEKGEPELNLNVKYEYQVIKAEFEKQTDDYRPGEYKLSQSNAAKVIMYVLKSTIEKELQEYMPQNAKVTIKITGSTDATPIYGRINYAGEYGWFNEEFAFINGMLDNVTVTKESGITTNEQLAFLRTYGVRNFMENYVSPLRVTNNKYEHYAVVSDKVGAEYRRISIEVIIHKAFDEKYPAVSGEGEETALRGSGDPLKGLNISKAKKQMETGNYFALIIGIDNYKGVWLPLKNAVRDAQTTEKLLRTDYKIDYFRTLYNETATRTNIMKEFSWLVENVSEKDNVFIYFSGHGDFKKELNKGYWVPADAQTTGIYEFISNSDIQTFLNGIKSKHTLLVSDACFSGDLFRGNTISVPFEETGKYYTKVHTLKSRQALTSGGVEPVMDGGREGHSVFTYYMLEMLKRNKKYFYDAGQLYNDLKIPVTNNSDQTPILQPVKNTGDEGGQFIFMKK